MRINLLSINKYFGDFHALRDINFTIEDGEFVVILGPSGCGKTTLLRIIAGLESPTSGKIFFNDKDITDEPPSKRNIGMVFQNYALYPHMTVYDNLAFPLRLKKLPKDVIDNKVKEIAEKMRLKEHLYKRPKQLSGGQRQRVALGRAIIKEPSVFLFDEPLSNLDANLRTEMRSEIGKLHRELGATSVYVTHDQVEAMSLADKIIVMKDGEVVQIGSPMEIYNNPRNIFVASFIGSPPMNIIKGEFENGRFVSGDVDLNFGFEYRGYGYLGFRPENADISEYGELYGRVSHREILGNESIVYLSISDALIAIKSDEYPPSIGENVPIKIRKYYVFDEKGNMILSKTVGV